MKIIKYFLVCAIVFSCDTDTKKTTQPPNVVIIFTDDQGYGDLSCMGATDFKTPNLDRLANEGARFKCWYSNSPVCSPSRAALLTGRYPANAGVRAILDGPVSYTHLRAHET